MRIKKVKYDKNEEPKTVTVELTVNQMALLYVFAGLIPDAQVLDTAGPDWNEARHGLYSGANHFFNQHAEEGAVAYAPARFADWYRHRVRITEVQQ